MHYIFDFDSTFTQVEALDELAEIAFAGKPEREQVVQQIAELTDRAMAGELDFREALEQRLQLLHANKQDLQQLVEVLKEKISPSVVRNKAFFEQNRDDILIISSGFKDFIVPVVAELGIPADQVYANTFTFDTEGKINGFDTDNPLSQQKGKVKLMQQLNLEGDVYVIGDGYTDYEIREAGYAKKFYAFTENVERQKVTDQADHVAPSFDEVLYVNQLPMSISYPKNRIKVLLLENIHPSAAATFEEEGYTVETRSGALDEKELAEAIKDVSILGIRSKTQLTAPVLENAKRLMLVGAFCIGTNQIDLDACLRKGVAVFNAPYSNTRSVVELAIGEIIMLMRNLPDKVTAMHQGKWEKSANNSFEIRGKKLGIVGYGNIGSQLSVLAEAMGMDVHYYDIVEKLALGNATKCSSLEELLQLSDVVSLHVDGRPENTNFFGEKQFEQMKNGSLFLNLARGPVVEEQALVRAINSGKVVGAGVDVFGYEPKTNSEAFEHPLKGLPNVILTPHIGGSTLEAQQNIADFVPAKLIEYVNTGNTDLSVNFPNLRLPILANAHRLLHIHKNVPGIMSKMNRVFEQHQINIVGQYLKTNEEIGYVITDVDKEYDPEVVKALKAIEHTIKFRLLY
jgi:D-3-phosphoglycerate dehydrogenase